MSVRRAPALHATVTIKAQADSQVHQSVDFRCPG
nr:hypothetical protein [Pseudomonas gingeri]